MNAKAKGTRAEHRAMRLLERDGCSLRRCWRVRRQVAPLEGKTANTPRLGPVSTSRQRIAELAR